MSTSAAHAAAFYADLSRGSSVWTIRADEGFPSFMNGSGQEVMPFWSRRTRVDRVVARVPAFSALSVVEIPLDEFLRRWLPGLRGDGIRVGVNWSGASATGYDLTVAELERNLAAAGVRSTAGGGPGPGVDA